MKPGSSRRKSKWGIFCAGLVLFFVVLSLGRFPLVIDDRGKFQHLDAVVVLAGVRKLDAVRVARGVDLFARYDAEYLVLPLRHSYLSWKWFTENYSLPVTINPSAVIIGTLDDESRNYVRCCGGTYAEAIKSYQLMSKLAIRQIAVVSSGYHLLRARMAFKRVFAPKKIRIFFVPVGKTGRADPFWWFSGADLLAVMNEYKKLIGGYFLYRPYLP